ncbi:hypothetical protein D1614_24265, partial [Maribellus luteus]
MLFDGAQAELVGQPNQGLAHMFTMMNAARLNVGVQGVAIAERAYQQALAFSQERRQGRSAWTGEASAPIFDHPDVRRSLGLAKAKIDFNVSIIFGGQIGEERSRLFNVYAAGNFIEATPENCYFQIGEAKYGKPIIDRVVSPGLPLDEAAKCALISMDSTLKSNISVGLPLDLLVYEADSLQVTRFVAIDEDN